MSGAATEADVDWSLASVVKSSDHRTQLVAALADRGETTPTELADVTGLLIQHVSRSLRRMRDDGIVELTVPESRQKGRTYALTEDGKAIVEALNLGEL